MLVYMKYLEFLTGEDDINRRLDRVARKFLATIPLSVLYKNIRNGFIRINGKKNTIDYRLQSGDVLFIEKNLFEKKPSAIPLSKLKTSINPKITTIFINKHIRIINKPLGINVHTSGTNQQSLDQIIKDEYMQQRGAGLHVDSLSFLPGPLHRLDRNTTGLLAFSQSLEGARWFSEAISKKNIQKKYITVLSGTLDGDMVWEHLLTDSKKNNSSIAKNFATVSAYEQGDILATDAKLARTFVQVLAQGTYKQEAITLALIQIETGRTHQIRAQSAFCGHPLIGDSAYGGKMLIPDFLLHAWSLEFPLDNPIGLPQRITAPLPISFADFIKYHLPDFSLLAYNASNETSK